MIYIKGALRFVGYRLFSRHRKGHGVHSPFVFNLITRVFRNKFNPDVVLLIERIRENKKSDSREIKVLDLGAGSVKMKSNKRKISDIATVSAVPRKYGILLANLASEFGGKSIIEFGTSLGISTMYLAAGNTGAKVYTMEGCPATAEIAGENFREAGFDNIDLKTGPFDGLFPGIIAEAGKPGFVFIDGNHRKEAVLRYFSLINKIKDQKTVVAVDDIHSSSEMEEAWDVIKKTPEVTTTVDVFRMGLIFFRKGITCNHYVIRY